VHRKWGISGDTAQRDLPGTTPREIVMLGISRGFFGRNHDKVTRRSRFQSQTADFQIPLPRERLIKQIYFAERSDKAILGGIRIGLTEHGSEVLDASPIGPKSLSSHAPKVGALSREDQRLYIEAAEDWNGAVLDCVVEYDVIPYE